jgi:hypothetical protein
MTVVQDKTQSPLVVAQGNPASIYVEGLSQLLLGFPNSRLMLFNMATHNLELPESPTVHNLACELVMPTPALLEMCKTVLKHAAEVSPMLKEGGEQWLAQVNQVLDSLDTAH